MILMISVGSVSSEGMLSIADADPMKESSDDVVPIKELVKRRYNHISRMFGLG